MTKHAFILLQFLFVLNSVFGQSETAKWVERANNTEIIRDEWGIPHIY